MPGSDDRLPVLDHLRRHVSSEAWPDEPTHMRYPTAISQTLGFTITAVEAGVASVRVDADATRHGNQQGTVHGGFLVELADAAIGTAHSTLMRPGESFTTIDLRVAFLRPVWHDTLLATARPEHPGRTISHYVCEIVRTSDNKPVATVTSTVMTLRGTAAEGR
ncbi:PaaI family thioesterase [Streptomyces sp. NPDC014872]|uniref:PaaI family thioesterase n=1 Tax=Streptomyces sp. NPDC014872 TaxID=3364926 RepID=UPI0036FCFD8C